MPRYKDLKKYSDSEADWIATQLLALRSDLSRRITNDRQPSSLIVGSWNLVKFDGGMPRLDDSYHFIAEIIANFDICAIQEVMPDLEPLKKLLTLLGPDWNYFVSDASDHKGGNQERMAFVYNTNKVFFRNLIGEIVTDEHVARTPFFAAFQAGWFRFTLVSSHIVFGTEGLQARADEITAISKAIVRRAKSEDQVYIFLGDMNIESPTDIVMQALKESGLEVPDFGPTNMAGTKYFDQIAFTTEGDTRDKTQRLRFGVFDWRDAINPYPDRPVQVPESDNTTRRSFKQTLDYYEPIVATHRKAHGEKPYKNFRHSYKRWSTNEMSDHLPIWVELETDYSDDYLRKFAQPE